MDPNLDQKIVYKFLFVVMNSIDLDTRQ